MNPELHHLANINDFHVKSNLERFLELTKPSIKSFRHSTFRELIKSMRELCLYGFKFAFDFNQL